MGNNELPSEYFLRASNKMDGTLKLLSLEGVPHIIIILLEALSCLHAVTKMVFPTSPPPAGPAKKIFRPMDFSFYMCFRYNTRNPAGTAPGMMVGGFQKRPRGGKGW